MPADMSFEMRLVIKQSGRWQKISVETITENEMKIKLCSNMSCKCEAAEWGLLI